MHKNHEEFDVPLTEDLMREHGILNRILLIYQAVIDKIKHKQEYPLSALAQSVEIIQLFIEGHHERMEEDYIFPLFEKHKKELAMIATLKQQHIQGREITANIQSILDGDNAHDHAVQLKIKHLLEEFIDMYRPHEAREDTEIFPMVRSFLTEKEFEELSEKFEQFEHQLLGEHGLENIMKKIHTIEKNLNIIF